MTTKKRTNTEVPTRAQEIDGPRDHPTAAPGRLRIQPMLPLGHPYFGMTILAAEFRRYPSDPSTWLVEVEATIGTVKQPYTLVLSVPQALDADIIERV
jgi:hypothetical protein